MINFRRIINHPIFKHSAVVLIGSMGANVAGWLYHVFVGRILGTEGYGELAALLSLFYILNVPSSVITTILVKFFSVLKAGGEEGQAKRLIRVATTKILLAEGVGLILLLLFSRSIAAFLNIDSLWYVVWLYLIFATFIVSVVNGSAIQGFQLFTASSVLATVGMTLRLVFGAGFAYLGVGWTLVSNIFSNSISFGLSFIPLRFIAKVEEKPLSINRTDALSFSIPAFITTLGITLLFSQDVLLVKHYFSSHEAGIYASLSVLGKVLFYATGAVSFVLFPVVSERNANGKGHTRLVAVGLMIIALVCIGLTAFYFIAPGIVLVAFGKAFFGAAQYMGPFAIFISFFSLSSILIQTLLALDKMKVWVITGVCALLQTFLIVLFHGTIFQVIGVNIAVSMVLFSSLLLYYAYGKKSA
ncbi:oligosaccharide flippase family protein [Candidatus Gottesmanbacteria bacterium]|nr:oligosaccharide flippase family protein [Candidatus Gottesmanbacteria bacterium]